MANQTPQLDVVTFWQSGVGKAFRAFLYAAVSALISLGITHLTKQNPLLAAELTPLINWALVQVKMFLDQNQPNLPTSLQ